MAEVERKTYKVQRSGREGRVGSAGETRLEEGQEGERQAAKRRTRVMEGKAPAGLTGGGRLRPAHLLGLSVLRWVVVGGGGAAGERGAIFLESFVCGGVHTRAVCVCNCRLRCAGPRVCRASVCGVCVSVPLSPG